MSSRVVSVAVVGASGCEAVRGVNIVPFCPRRIFAGSPVINSEHWLYWGERILTTEENSNVVIRLIEQTEFLDDETYEPIAGPSKEEYCKRAAKINLSSRDKLMYIRKEQLGLEADFPQHALPDGKFSVDAFIVVCDVSKAFMQNHETKMKFLSSLLSNVVKTKKPAIIALTKSDRVDEEARRAVMTLLARKEFKAIFYPPIEVSSIFNVNVDEIFFTSLVICLCPIVKRLFLVDESRQRIKSVYLNLLSSVIPVKSWPAQRFTWNRLLADLDRHPDFIAFVKIFGQREAYNLYEQHVCEAKEHWMSSKLRSFIPQLPQIFATLLERPDFEDLDWSLAKEKIVSHALFDDFFQPIGSLGRQLDPMTPDGDYYSRGDPRVPAEILMREEARYTFESFKKEAETARRKEKLEEDFENLLAESKHITPGKPLKEVHLFLQGFPAFDLLSPNQAATVYDRYQNDLMKRAECEFIECLLEYVELFTDSLKRMHYENLTPAQLNVIKDVLEADLRYRWLSRVFELREKLILDMYSFWRQPSPPKCFNGSRCADFVVPDALEKFFHRRNDNSYVHLVDVTVHGDTSIVAQFITEINCFLHSDPFQSGCGSSLIRCFGEIEGDDRDSSRTNVYLIDSLDSLHTFREKEKVRNGYIPSLFVVVCDPSNYDLIPVLQQHGAKLAAECDGSFFGVGSTSGDDTTCPSFSKIVKKLKVSRVLVFRTAQRYWRLGTSDDIQRRGRPVTVTTPEAVKAVREKIRRTPERSARKLLAGTKDDSHLTTLFTDEKIFTVEANNNGQNHPIIATDYQSACEKGKILNKTSHPASVMVFTGITADDKTPLIFVDPGVKGVALSQFSLRKPTMDLPARRRPHSSCQRDSRVVSRQFSEFISAADWPASSPDLNPMDYTVWGYLTEKVSSKNYPSIKALKTVLIKKWDEIDDDYLRAVIDARERVMGICDAICSSQLTRRRSDLRIQVSLMCGDPYSLDALSWDFFGGVEQLATFRPIVHPNLINVGLVPVDIFRAEAENEATSRTRVDFTFGSYHSWMTAAPTISSATGQLRPPVYHHGHIFVYSTRRVASFAHARAAISRVLDDGWTSVSGKSILLVALLDHPDHVSYESNVLLTEGSELSTSIGARFIAVASNELLTPDVVEFVFALQSMAMPNSSTTVSDKYRYRNSQSTDFFPVVEHVRPTTLHLKTPTSINRTDPPRRAAAAVAASAAAKNNNKTTSNGEATSSAKADVNSTRSNKFRKEMVSRPALMPSLPMNIRKSESFQTAPLATPEMVEIAPEYSLVKDALSCDEHIYETLDHAVLKKKTTPSSTASSTGSRGKTSKNSLTSETLSQRDNPPNSESCRAGRAVSRRARTALPALMEPIQLHRTTNLTPTLLVNSSSPPTAIRPEIMSRSVTVAVINPLITSPRRLKKADIGPPTATLRQSFSAESLSQAAVGEKKAKRRDFSGNRFVRKVATSFRFKKDKLEEKRDEGRKSEEAAERRDVVEEPIGSRSLPQSPQVDRKQAKKYASLNATERVTNALSWLPSRSPKRSNKSATTEIASSVSSSSTTSVSAQGVVLPEDTLDSLCAAASGGVPDFVSQCISIIEETGGLESEGLYRVPGNQAHVLDVERIYRDTGVVDLSSADVPVHVGATALKNFFSCLPLPLIPTEIHSSIISCVSGEPNLDQLKMALNGLPSCNRDVLQFLIKHLQKVSQSPVTAMDMTNLSKVWFPTLFRPAFNSYEALSAGTHLYQKAMEVIFENADSLLSHMATSTSESQTSLGDGEKRYHNDKSIDDRIHQQLVYKDNRIIDLNNVILDKERQILDLQERVREQGEVANVKNQALRIVQQKFEEINRERKDMSTETDNSFVLSPSTSTSYSARTEKVERNERRARSSSPGHAIANRRTFASGTFSPPPIDPPIDTDNDASFIESVKHLDVDGIKRKSRKRVTFDLPPSAYGSTEELASALTEASSENSFLRKQIEELNGSVEKNERTVRARNFQARVVATARIKSLEETLEECNRKHSEQVEKLQAEVDTLRSSREWELEQNGQFREQIAYLKEKSHKLNEELDVSEKAKRQLDDEIQESKKIMELMVDDLLGAENLIEYHETQKRAIFEDVDRLKDAILAQDRFIEILEADIVIYEQHIGLLRESLGASKIDHRALIKSKAFETKLLALEKEKEMINRKSSETG
ncbi:unnamed protein product [Caenorhabditis auriculariae]|uniref:Rho-GAP domain-containing protein n=1 Tax=Caenorhabditis auriculariae TaxID=2777116 RepID=A0A8S1HIW5_9PELO|nr:unnamed protein product [Caenorhabditis auriculariae]